MSRLCIVLALLVTGCDSSREVAGFQLGSERFEALQEARDRRLVIECEYFGTVSESCLAQDAAEKYNLVFREDRLVAVGVPLRNGGTRWDSVGAPEPWIVEPENSDSLQPR